MYVLLHDCLIFHGRKEEGDHGVCELARFVGIEVLIEIVRGLHGECVDMEQMEEMR